MDDPSSSDSFARALGASTTEGLIISDVQLVKGLTFDTASRYFAAEFGQDRWDALLAKLPPEIAQLVREADINEWYPEAELRRLMRLVYTELADRRADRFMELARGLALAGISRFFRVLMNFASGRFVLRKVPVIWKRLRRGPATLTTEIAEDGRVLVHYDNYIYCHDAVYRLLSMANCQALVFAATKKIPKAEVVRHDRLTMTLAFTLADDG